MVAGKPISFLATAAPQETIAFYRDVLGLDLIEENMYALVFSDNGQMLRIQKVPEHAPPAHTVHGWEITEIAAEIEILAAKGVEFSIFSYLSQADNGVWTAPNGDQVAWFHDPVGNNLSLTQFAKQG